MNILEFLIGIIAPEAEAFLKVAKLLKVGGTEALMKQMAQRPQAILKRINKLSQADKKSFSDTLLAVVGDPQKVAVNLGKMGAKKRKQFSEFQEATTKIDETRNLSSSWQRKGRYMSTGYGVGEFTLWTKQGKSYNYPGMPLKVWKAMKAAKGKNGNGSGSVFWALYLRAYSKSYVGQLTAKLGKLSGINTSPLNISKLASR